MLFFLIFHPKMLYFSYGLIVPTPALPLVGSRLVTVRTQTNMYFVYVLKSKIDNKFYYGFTDNLKRRLENHNNKLVKSTKARAPFELIYYENVDNIKNARVKEKYLIGNINKLGGICDDCMNFEYEDKIIRYKIILTEEEIEKLKEN